MKIRNPDWVMVTNAKRAVPKPCQTYGRWRSVSVPYHQGVLGIIHHGLKNEYADPFIPVQPNGGINQGIHIFPFHEDNNGLFCESVTYRDIIVVLYDPKNPRDLSRGKDGFYAVKLQRGEFQDIDGRDFYHVANIAAHKAQKRGYRLTWEEYNASARELVTFDIRFANRLREVPLELALNLIPNETLRHLEQMHAPLVGGLLPDAPELLKLGR